jgi:hypothetical protein
VGPSGGTCAGGLVLRPVDSGDDAAGGSYGSASFSIPSGADRVLRVRASRQVLAELRQDEEVEAQAITRIAQPSGQTTTATQPIAIE